MFKDEALDKLRKKQEQWEETTLKKSLQRFGVEKSPTRIFTPLDVPEFDFERDVGYPGEFPFTRGTWPSRPPMQLPAPTRPRPKRQDAGSESRERRMRASVGSYSGFGTPKDTRDMLMERGALAPNIAFDLPTQCGYDSDSPQSLGEVGRVGVSVDTLRDFEIIYEAFEGRVNLDQMRSNFTINGPAMMIIAMYVALAEKKGIASDRLMGTPQNDILKEFIARGTFVFPPRPSMRLTRDIIVYCTEHMPLMNTVSICGYHIREAGATAAQELAFTFADAIAYTQLGVDAGLDVDQFAERFSFLGGGGMNFFEEIAKSRAARRMWAKIMRDRFGAKNPRTWRFRGPIGGSGNACYTAQKPHNNIVRGAIGGLAQILSNLMGPIVTPYDEALGLAHGRHATEVARDASMIILYETGVADLIDPLAGSYYVESLTDAIEAEAFEYIEKIDEMGGAVPAIEKGYIQSEIAKSAYEYMKQVETGERLIVGVNVSVEEEVPMTGFVVDPSVEERQLKSLAKLKKERTDSEVQRTIDALRKAAEDEDENLFPYVLDAVKAYATIGEMCNALREVFGEYRDHTNVG